MHRVASPPSHQICVCFRLKSFEHRLSLAWCTRLSCAAERAKRRLDFLFGRNSAALRVVDGLQLVRCRMIDAAVTAFDFFRVLGQLLLVRLRPSFGALE